MGKTKKTKSRRPLRGGTITRPRWVSAPGAAGAVAAMALFGAVVFYLLGGDPAQDGEASVDGVRTIEGSVHTILHSEAPLPSSSRPRADDMPTLVWFSGPWCHFCHEMSPFAYQTAAEFADDLVFIEKSVDHDRHAAGMYGIRGTPTFVLIDANGAEVGRLGFQRTPADFRHAISELLTRSET